MYENKTNHNDLVSVKGSQFYRKCQILNYATITCTSMDKNTYLYM